MHRSRSELKHAPRGRCVFLAPHVALCEQRFKAWSHRFGAGLGKKVVRLTGETAADLRLLETGQIVIATPTQWDKLGRWGKQRKAVQKITLFIADDLHLTHWGGAGADVGVVVSRMRYIAAQTENGMRLLGLATSLANARDTREWLGAKPRTTFNFSPAVRCVA